MKEDKNMRRPVARHTKHRALSQGYEFTENGRRFKVVGHTIREVTEKPADIVLGYKPGTPSALDEQARRANARLAADSNLSLFARFMRTLFAW